ncbi:hypothetical protein L1987_57403 [Smallanthus sonchifolius]|uniref:Uncharacterized protein n=1 Tax=Smallanthus sonchifolius TaxID=185202 RepID=A0ACB9DCE3_9ASTR|nr:hypothetical protein L1987_57403 [Smallanthus sonchifolius]
MITYEWGFGKKTEDAGGEAEKGRRLIPATSYYVSNLPEGTTSKDLAPYFQNYGRLVDIYVAAKKDKSGSFFGFVRFEDVDNKWELEKAMTEIHIDNARLSVNLAKFDRDGKPNNREVQRSRNGPDNCKYQPKKEVKVPKDADYGVVEWYDKSVIGKALDITQLCGFHDFLTAKLGKVDAPSHATFSNEGLIRDTVGMMVTKEWNIQEEINLKWRDKTYTVRCKEDEDGWCPGWCDKNPENGSPSPAPTKDLVRPEEDEKTSPGNSEPRAAQESSVLVEPHSPCMGKENSSLNASRSKKKSAAHRIIISIGPNPRKRPRAGSFDNDPFLLDDIINKTGKGAESLGKQKPNMAIPDLNTAMVTTSVGSSENPLDKE